MSSVTEGERFRTLWQAHGGRDAQRVFEELAAHYAEPGRYYHTLAHIRRCLRTLDRHRAAIAKPAAVELALWCHDVIFRPGARDNEAQSADWWRARAAGIAAPTTDCVAGAILATTHQSPPTDAVAAWTADIDLAGLALSASTFARDGAKLRAERPELSDAEYWPRERAFLAALLARPRLYHTAELHAALEAAARANLARRIAALTRRSGRGR